VTAIGAATAIIVGCVGITPAAGFISPGWAMVLGALAAVPSYYVIVWRARTRVDETLDVLAAHGVAGLTGIIFIGFFAQQSWNGVSDGLLYGDAGQLGWHLISVLATPVYAFAMTYALLKLIGVLTPLRGSDHDEAVGMDIVHHGEEAYASGEGAILVKPNGAIEDALARRRTGEPVG
jgi:Amt family ammonium transporter